MEFTGIAAALVDLKIAGALVIGVVVAYRAGGWLRQVIEDRSDARYDAAHNDRRT